MAPYDALAALAAVNGHMSGVYISEDTQINPAKWQGMKLVKPGSHDWLMLHNLRSRKVRAAARKEYMKRLKWYKRDAYDGEFVYDCVCANDLLCWARDCFDRNGDIYPGQNPEKMTQEDLSDFALVMEDFYAEHFGDSTPRILDINLCTPFTEQTQNFMAPTYDALAELAAVNGQLSGVHIKPDTPVNAPYWQDVPLIKPGSQAWLLVRVLRSRKVAAATKQEYMRRLKWYKRCAYSGDFVYDFVCAADLLCWARDCFNSHGDVYPGQTPEKMTQEDLSDFASTMEEFYAKYFGDSAPRIMDVSYVYSVYADSSLCLLSDGRADDELGYAVMALEMAGRPPLTINQP
ncbi:hypothetical protein WJX73_003708 [Symbiochloris irregularis]|uniref:Uncharacterized protein n=1 Tax=Symbiochloris irregularis TaxID=706552 RepID=A0AAW1P816_9CHLO